MTYSYIHEQINTDAFPKAIHLYDKELMTSRGYGKYCYKKHLKDEASNYIEELLHNFFKDNEIKYIV